MSNSSSFCEPFRKIPRILKKTLWFIIRAKRRIPGEKFYLSKKGLNVKVVKEKVAILPEYVILVKLRI